MRAVEKEKNEDWLHHELNWVNWVLDCICVLYVVFQNHASDSKLFIRERKYQVLNKIYVD